MKSIIQATNSLQQMTEKLNKRQSWFIKKNPALREAYKRQQVILDQHQANLEQLHTQLDAKSLRLNSVMHNLSILTSAMVTLMRTIVEILNTIDLLTGSEGEEL